ncbi:flavanone 3-dioxygenase 3-like [Mercurialis annua]|uniref:flavanone 3-dioxygenase 3-like n=1 Tax=Mercurialis annua TaxID=3986 RepID=UPI00215EF4FB|nr:flavanone 3-dioxygenase 3-like [Mercurialis annua]
MNSNHDLQTQEVPIMPLSNLPIIDLSLLPHNKTQIVQEIGKACQKYGFFNIINHGISESVIEAALETNSKFFDLPLGEKLNLISDDVHSPIRFGSIKDERGNGRFTRDFLKLYAYPLQDWIGSWPPNPSDYREKMGTYSKEMRRLGIEIFGAIMESLNISQTHHKHEFEQGMHIMAVNRYHPIPEANVLTGIPPHTDHSIITILLQSSSGLQILDRDDNIWKAVIPQHNGNSLQVLVGDHLQVLSNGACKSVLHRAIPGSEEKRLSVVSLHSFGMDDVVEPAVELVDENHPKCYKGSSLRDFLNHLSSKVSESFIHTLQINS